MAILPLRKLTDSPTVSLAAAFLERLNLEFARAQRVFLQ